MKLRNWKTGIAVVCLASSLCAGHKPSSYDEKNLRSGERNSYRSTSQSENRMGRITPSARGCPTECGFYMALDFLYWRAQNHGFQYAYDQFEGSAFAGPLNGATLGNLVRISQDWDPGFRIGLGWNTAYDWWDIFLNWTYYHNRSTDSVTRAQKFPGNVDDGLYPLWPAPVLVNIPAYGNASGLWRLNFNAIDLEIGRAYYISKALSFRPQWGVRAAWIYQDFGAQFRDPFDAANLSLMNFDGEDNYWGVGPRAGVRADWMLGCGISILGNIATSVLYGRTMTYYLTQVENPANSGTFAAFVRHKDNFSQLVPNLQLQLGLGWGQCFDDWFFFALNATWETNFWWNRMNVMQTVASQGAGSVNTPAVNYPLTMEGVTFSAKPDF